MDQKKILENNNNNNSTWEIPKKPFSAYEACRGYTRPHSLWQMPTLPKLI
jgi:hypothetical protein